MIDSLKPSQEFLVRLLKTTPLPFRTDISREILWEVNSSRITDYLSGLYVRNPHIPGSGYRRWFNETYDAFLSCDETAREYQEKLLRLETYHKKLQVDKLLAWVPYSLDVLPPLIVNTHLLKKTIPYIRSVLVHEFTHALDQEYGIPLLSGEPLELSSWGMIDQGIMSALTETRAMQTQAIFLREHVSSEQRLPLFEGMKNYSTHLFAIPLLQTSLTGLLGILQKTAIHEKEKLEELLVY